jgi:ribose transport system substrate-binding protein
VNGPKTESDIDGQIELVREAIAKKPDALILAAGDYERLAPLCERAAASGIKLIIVDSDVNFDKKDCFIGTDNFELGKKLGELVNSMLEPDERFGVIGHVESSFTALERYRGLSVAVLDYESRLAALRYCDGIEDLARRQTIGIIRENPDIDCMVGLNESSALGICQAIEELGLIGKIRVITCDSSEAQIKYMENGTIQAFVIQNPFNMGYLSMEAAVRILQGKPVESRINTESFVIDRDEMRRPQNQKLLFPFDNDGS